MIFQFKSTPAYLNEYLRRLPKQGYGEARRIAAHLDVSSTYVSQVLSGEKTLTLEQGIALSPYLGLSPIETDYFLLLIQSERAGNDELKKYFARKISQLKTQALKIVNRIDVKKTLSDQEKSVFYSNALYSAIHIYCATASEGRTLDEICERFSISRSRTKEIIGFLVEASLCIERDGRFLTGTQSTHLEQGSPHLLKHYSNWRLRALQAAENLQAEELMYTVNVALSKTDFAALREEMVGFIKAFLQRVHPSPSEEIACLNMDWFWIRN